jgi:CheY-like chemotaxis protein
LIGDPLRLQQIVVNLLGNAIKYTHQGSVSLRAGSRPAAMPGRVELRFDIVDTGIGIPREKLSAIFEKFTQADNSITRQYGGTGLGLSICKELVDMHGGRIWLESEVGRGSSFHVVLEMQVAQDAPTDAQEVGAPVVADTAAGGAERAAARILVVEDNPTNQRVVAGLLGKRGYQTHVVSDGRQALEALEGPAFDLILMDLQMPVLDGLEATRLIRLDPRWRSLPIIGLTAHVMAGDRERCLEAGMDDYLAKPVRPPALLEAVAKHLSERPTAVAASPASSQ